MRHAIRNEISSEARRKAKSEMRGELRNAPGREATSREAPRTTRHTTRRARRPGRATLAMQMNPVLWREWRGRWRRPLTPIAVGFYAALIALAAWYVYPEQQGLETRESTSEAMLTMLKTLSRWQMVLGSLLAATMAAASVVSEKERGLWTMLRLSPLSPAQIVQGKMMASFAFIALLIFVPLPMSVTLLLIGGVPAIECALVLLLQLTTALLCGALALTISARSRSVATAMGAALPCAAAILLFPLLTFTTLGAKGFFACALLCVVVNSLLTWGQIFRVAPNVVAREILGDIGEHIHRAHSLLPHRDEMPPLVLLPQENLESAHHETARTIEAQTIEAPSQAAVAAMSMRESVEALEKQQEEEWFEASENKAPKSGAANVENVEAAGRLPSAKTNRAQKNLLDLPRSPASQTEGPIVALLHFRNPVLQRAARGHFRFWCRLQKEELVAYGSMAFVLWACAMAMLATLCFEQMRYLEEFKASMTYFAQTSDFTVPTHSNHADALWAWWWLGVLWIAFSTVKVASLSFAADRAQGMLKPLLMTRLTPRDIVWGKLGAALLAGLAPAVLFVPFAGFAFAFAPLGTLAALLVLASCLWLCATFGVLCAWFCETPAISICGTAAMLVGLGVGPLHELYDASLLSRFLQRQGVWPLVQSFLYPTTGFGWLQLGALTASIGFAIGLLALMPVLRALRPSALEKDKKSILITDLSKAF